MKGKVIVLEGTDGSGKATQTALVCEELKKRGILFEKIEFPRYNEPSSALIKMYLGGELGDHPEDVNAYAASTFFAVDRYASYKQDWGKFYESGGIIIADRYTTSNIVHQMSKVHDDERKAYIDWLTHFEYDLLGLPKPDKVLYLDLPISITEQMMKDRTLKSGEKKDIHEMDDAYLRKCHDNADFTINALGWERIRCDKDGAIRSIEDIHADVMEKLKDIL